MDTESRELTPEALRDIADWFDTYDALALRHFDLLEQLGLAKADDLNVVRRAASGTEIQDDLRRWATELEWSDG